MKKILWLVFMLFCTQIFTQNEGDKHRKNGDLEKAILAYKSDLKTKPNDLY